MPITIEEINKFSQQQVKKGFCNSIKEAKNQIILKIEEQELDEALTIGEEDIKAGRYSVVDDKWKSQYMKKLANRLLSTSNDV